MAPLDVPSICCCTCLPDGHDHRFFFVTETTGKLAVGEIDDVRSVHVTRAPFKESLIALSLQPETDSLLVLASPYDFVDTSTSNLYLLDPTTYQQQDSFELKMNEIPLCVTTGSVYPCFDSPQDNSLFVVGTAFVLPDESEPSHGRLLVIRSVMHHLELVCETTLNGGCLSVSITQGKIICGVNSELQVFEMNNENEITKLCNKIVSICVTNMDVEVEGQIVIGDVLRSVAMYEMNLRVIDGRQLCELEYEAGEMIQRDVTALCRLPECKERLVVGDAYGNLCMMAMERETDLDRANPQKRVMVKEWFHLNDQINRFVPVMLFRNGGEEKGDKTKMESSVLFNVAFATVSGRIGVIGALEDKEFSLLRSIETAMEEVGMMKLYVVDHYTCWRTRPSQVETE